MRTIGAKDKAKRKQRKERVRKCEMKSAKTYVYADRGCHLHPKCLECPRPTCILDDAVARAG